MSHSTQRQQPRSLRIALAIIALVLTALCGQVTMASAAPVPTDDPFLPVLGYDPDTGMEWDARVGDVFIGHSHLDKQCETTPGRTDGYRQVYVYMTGSLIQSTVTFTTRVDGLPGESSFIVRGGENSNFPINELTAGDYDATLSWHDASGQAQSYPLSFTIGVCEQETRALSVVELDRTTDGLAGDAGNGSLVVLVSPGDEAKDTDVEYTVFLRDVSDDMVFTTRENSSVKLTFDQLDASGLRLELVVKYGSEERSFTFDPIEYAGPKHALPKASVTGTAKVVVSPVTRSLCVENTRDDSKAHDYTGTLAGKVSKVFRVTGVGDGRKKCTSFSLPAGGYNVKFTGAEGTSNTVKFTVAAYPRPTFMVTDRARGKIRVCVSFPSSAYSLRWEDGNSAGTKFGRNHNSNPRSACTTLNTPDVKPGKINTVRVTVRVAGPNIVKIVRIDRR